MSEVEVSAEMEQFISYVEKMSVLELTNLVDSDDASIEFDRKCGRAAEPE